MPDSFSQPAVVVSPGMAAEGWAFTPPPGAGRPPAGPATAPTRPAARARYDAAETNAENAKLWAPADGLSARSANDPATRHKLRNRARYEIANNSYAKGVCLTLANEVVGTGPRLQLKTGDPDVDRDVPRAFDEWAAEVRLAERLRTVVMARVGDGEAFPHLSQNPRLGRTPIRLDFRADFEADQVCNPFLSALDPLDADGIIFDRWGNPVEYVVREDHPGDSLQLKFGKEIRVPASRMMHWFRVDRPGQLRGVPEITPALHLFGLLRRYTLAVLAAAETAADFAAVLFSDLPPEIDPATTDDPQLTLDIERRVMTTLPRGWKMGQFKAEQPATTYAMFKAELLNEIFRCILMPYNVGAGNSSGYNYASGRLDHQGFYKAIGILQYDMETAILDRVFAAWIAEAALVGMVPRGLASFDAPARVPHQWFWDGVGHVDPLKEAGAQAARLANGTTTLADEWARAGHDWRAKADQQAEERAYYRSLGIPHPGDKASPAGGGGDPGPAPDGDEESEADDGED